MNKAAMFNRFYPVFIHGEARGEKDEFIVHCRYPRFLARRSFDDAFTGSLPAVPVAGEIGRLETGGLAYKSNAGVWFSDFIFFDARPADEAEFVEKLRAACNAAVADGLMLDDETEGLGDD